MQWKYSDYSDANAGITVGVIVGSILFVIAVIVSNRDDGLRSLLEKMFGIKYTRSESG